MCAHHRAGALAIEVEIADLELFGGGVELFAGVGVDGAGEAVLGVVGDREGLGKVEALMMARTGPKISSWAMRAVGATSAKTVGVM